jgi:nucleoside 2-deoxyribosyltransferase
MNSSENQASELIYVSGALSAQTQEEMEAFAMLAIEKAKRIKEKGHMPFVPHCSIFYYGKMPWMEYQDWLKLDLRMLPAFDAILIEDTIQNKRSVGTMAELGWATAHGLKIYKTVEEIPIYSISNVVSKDTLRIVKVERPD